MSVGAYATTSRPALGSGITLSDDRDLPNITNGVAAGDVSFNNATIWSRADRPARMIVEVSSSDRFEKVRRFVGPEVLRHSDFTGKVSLRNLPVGEQVFYRVQFQDLDNSRRYGAPVIGQLKTAARTNRDVRFAWSGDTAGQGFGIDATRGGMQTYDAIRQLAPDFFVHSGDVCYSDGPFESEIMLDDGTVWQNLVTKDTSKVAESLREFRANFRYNLMDETVRQFNAHVPLFAQWDDHETTNNWYPGERLVDDDRYTVKSVSLLAARAKQAFFDYMPIRQSAEQAINRQISYGPRLDLFFLDLRCSVAISCQLPSSCLNSKRTFLGSSGSRGNS